MTNQIQENRVLEEKGIIHENCRIINSSFGRYTEIASDNFIENSYIDDYSYTGPFCIIQNTQVLKFSNIAAMVRIGPTAHPMERPTLHHFTYRRKKYGFSENDDESFFMNREAQLAVIGHDTWIGHGAIIMPGLKIGHGSVIGAGAVVTRDIPDYSVAAGCPAAVIRKRFSDKQADELKKIEWWEWTYEELAERLEDFSLPVDDFINKYRRQ